mmetsp:Transcript_15450/g.38442  ORF Transcript_15450/g.38442 Transcript_15450/m.38442 type:complete len:255 (-) Transcript_15450:5128-5892(-)
MANFRHVLSKERPKNDTRLGTSASSNARQRPRANAWCVSRRAFESFATANRSGATIRRLEGASSERPTAAPTAVKPASITISLSSFIYPTACFLRLLDNDPSRSFETLAVKTRRIAHALPCRISPGSSLSPRIDPEISSSVFSGPATSQAAPIAFAAASRIVSSEWPIKVAVASKADDIVSGSLAFLPPSSSTTAKASSVAVWTTTTAPEFSPTDEVPAVLFPSDPETSSLIKGSTRVDRGINRPSAPIASNLT